MSFAVLEGQAFESVSSGTTALVKASAASRGADRLLAIQLDDGSWYREFEMDVRQPAEYIFLKHLLHEVEPEQQAKMVRFILRKERHGGGWPLYHGGPPDLSTTVTAWYALRLAGLPEEHPALQRARDVVLANGGVMEANCFTRFFLMLFGQMDRRSLPVMPPEIVLFPKWFPFNLYSVSSWTRGIMVPLFILWAKHKDQPSSGDWPSITSLLAPGDSLKRMPQRYERKLFSWKNFFLFLNSVGSVADRILPGFIRRRAINECHKWLAQHCGREGGLGAIFPAMLNSILALRSLGYDKQHRMVEIEQAALDRLLVEDAEEIRIQPCVSVIWDTAFAMHVAIEAGVSAHDPKMLRARAFILSQQVHQIGDWHEHISTPTPCGGWAFENENALYPDVDDTSACIVALSHYKKHEPTQQALARAVHWVLAMQTRCGGWAAFDKSDRVYQCFDQIPFAEHGAMLDPPTVDVTARTIEALATQGFAVGHEAIDRAVIWLLKQQEPDGSWYGRWGVNYIYGTWAALVGLHAVGFDMSHQRVRKAVRWLLDHQNHDGGWGEACESYKKTDLRGHGESTASQTAWAMLGLIAAGEIDNPAVAAGRRFLVERQRPDGEWDELAYTGTGFPGVAYLRYGMYRLSFPTLVLAEYEKLKG